MDMGTAFDKRGLWNRYIGYQVNQEVQILARNNRYTIPTTNRQQDVWILHEEAAYFICSRRQKDLS